MSAEFERLGLFTQSAHPSRRKVARARVHAEVLLSTASGESVPAVIGDVSSHGCSVRAEAQWLRMGRFVAVTLGDDQPLQAIVRWTRDGTAGLEFLRPVSADRTEWRSLVDPSWEE